MAAPTLRDSNGMMAVIESAGVRMEALDFTDAKIGLLFRLSQALFKVNSCNKYMVYLNHPFDFQM